VEAFAAARECSRALMGMSGKVEKVKNACWTGLDWLGFFGAKLDFGFRWGDRTVGLVDAFPLSPGERETRWPVLHLRVASVGYCCLPLASDGYGCLSHRMGDAWKIS
jgi:hypothetical protein